MPPPPPPSKSYLLNFTDSDLEDDDDDDDDSAPCFGSTSPTATQSTANEEDADEDDAIQDESSTIPTKSKKKRKKKKKKKKKGSNAAPTATTKKQVSFSDVRIRAFERSFYSDGVPSDGGWPLGFDSEKYTDEEDPISIDVYEKHKQERLQERWQEVRPDEAMPSLPLETRQWDFKFGIKNPLFRALAEKKRRQLILGLPPEKKTPSPPASSPSKSSSTAPQHSHNTRSKRANSFSDNNHHHHGRRKSHSKTADDLPADFEARHVQMELEQLRTERSRQGAKGCTCRKLHVYIPPPNAGKKAAHRRMNVKQVKEELRARNALPEKQGSREDLERLLQQVVAAEPCCRDETCECVAAGIDCQDDACACWWASHHHLKETLGKASPAVIRQRCGNVNGTTTVDFEEIEQHRRPFITCQPVSYSASTTASNSSSDNDDDDDDSNPPNFRKRQDVTAYEEKKIEGTV